MAMTYQPVFAQTPKALNSTVNTLNAAMDGTGTIVTLCTAGSNGALVTHCHVVSQATSVLTALRLFISTDGATWQYVQSFAIAAFTVATTTAQTPTLIIDRNNPDAAFRLPAGARLGAALGVATPLRVYTEWMDF